jgi:hypothetical protein
MSSISGISRRVNALRYLSTSASAVFMKYWYTKYGLFFFLSSQIALPSDFQNFLPDESIINGIVITYISASQSVFFLNISVPVTIFHR